jgi:hypothetical protein
MYFPGYFPALMRLVLYSIFFGVIQVIFNFLSKLEGSVKKTLSLEQTPVVSGKKLFFWADDIVQIKINKYVSFAFILAKLLNSSSGFVLISSNYQTSNIHNSSSMVMMVPDLSALMVDLSIIVTF